MNCEKEIDTDFFRHMVEHGDQNGGNGESAIELYCRGFIKKLRQRLSQPDGTGYQAQSEFPK
jgi:hypothetical protein